MAIGKALTVIVLLALLLTAATASAESNFPPPQFEKPHPFPEQLQPAGRAAWQGWLDVAALALALSAASYLALVARSRRGLFWLSIASLAYFGFYREGCVCSIGSIQNVALGLADPSYSVPLVVALFFLLPLIFTLFFGRTYCAAVCPMGALQDLVVLRPVSLPAGLEHALGLIPFVYLGAAVLFTITAGIFLVCRYDPFVPFYRLSGSWTMLALGGLFLVVGIFIGRPYCRFFCPYGAILRVLSRFSHWTIRISPTECVDCRLCEASCPYGAIHQPAPGLPPRERPAGRRLLLALLGAAPLFIAAGAGVGYLSGGALARLQPTVQLAHEIWHEEKHDLPFSDASKVYRKTGRPLVELYRDALTLRAGFRRSSAILGGFLGLVVAAKLIALARRPRRTGYEADPGACVACGRCFLSCPKEYERRRSSATDKAGPPALSVVTK